ncbi:MAG: arginine--tRNA ligase, partial [Spirochaetales bacterium]
QAYHFKVLFHVLRILGYAWAGDLRHLAYGMVNLPEGKMKSREGTVVDADDLLDELSVLAGEEIEAKGREELVGDVTAIAESIALGALNYFLLQSDPLRDMTFNPRESLSFTGNTGPYLQYTGARISSMIKKFESRKEEFSAGVFRADLLTVPEEWEIIKLLSLYPEITEAAAEQLNPSLVAGCLYDMARLFSRYYHDNPVLHNDDPDLVVTRITLSRAVGIMLKQGFKLLGIPFLEVM